MSEPILEQCDSEHFFYKLSDHPKNYLGNSRCPYCMSIGLDKLRYEEALLEIENNQLRDTIFELRKANEK